MVIYLLQRNTINSYYYQFKPYIKSSFIAILFNQFLFQMNIPVNLQSTPEKMAGVKIK